MQKNICIGIFQLTAAARFALWQRFFLIMAICGWRFVSFVLPLVARVAAGAAVFSCGCRCWAVALICDVVLVVSTMVAVCCSFWLMPLSVAPL